MNDLQIPLSRREAEFLVKPFSQLEEEEIVLHSVRTSTVDSKEENHTNILLRGKDPLKINTFYQHGCKILNKILRNGNQWYIEKITDHEPAGLVRGMQIHFSIWKVYQRN